MKKIIPFIGLCLLLAAELAYAAFTEPLMSDYTAIPINLTQSVEPNIMIILDNSGSMNYNAYGTYAGDDKTVTDAPFTGEPYSGMKSFQVASAQDDAEEGVAAGNALYYANGDLDMGGWGVATNDSMVGIRFQNVFIPQGVTIYKAFLEFKANASNAETTYLLIDGEASDDATPFSQVADNLKSRTATTATVSWDNVQAWTAGQFYPSPDISNIVQEIVNRGGWSSGNSMVFRFTGVGTTDNKRDIAAYDAGSSSAPTLHVIYYGNDPDATRYYGYFNPDFFYSYASKFELAYKKVGYDFNAGGWNLKTLGGVATFMSDADIVTNKLWDGNWLNWASMRRVDVLRKVLMGGLATARTGGGNQVNYGETPTQTYRVWRRTFDSSNASPVSPYDGSHTYQVKGGRIYVDPSGVNDYYELRIQKNITYEPEDFMADGNLSGILQRVGDKARWGNIWFNDGTGSKESGGTVEHTIGTNMVTMITDLQNTGCDTWTPLAEAFYVAMQYFKQEDPASGLDYSTSAVPNANAGDDPYNNGADVVPCAKSFVLLLTDGASTKDSKIPSTYKDYDGDGDKTGCDEASETNCDYPTGGTDFLDDLALYARTNDLRADLENDQNLYLYAIYAFGNDDNARSLLRDAARNGGFEDRNGNNKPDGTYSDPADQRLEWDKDGDGVPDTFFEASDGYQLEAKLLAAITDMLKRASSGTTASVLATNNLGAGNSVQSYYRPIVTSGTEDVRWLGYMQSMWVDPWGNLREDTNHNLKLDLRSSGSQSTADGNVDRIVQVVNDGSDTVGYIYTKHYLYNTDNGPGGDCTLADCNNVFDKVTLDTLQPLFEAGLELSKKNPNNRKIFTYVGTSGVVGSGDDIDASGDVILFDTGTSSRIQPFLGVRNDTVWGDSGAGLGADIDTRTSNIIKWTRGTDVTGLRNRTLDGVTWRLGDIVNSTPLVVGPAVEYYHLLYEDQDYIDYINFAKNRETVVYVGGNDGMMHAFTHYILKKDPVTQDLSYEPVGGTSESIGEELWAYIPQCLLPHLKWTASDDYTHTYYVNSEPRIFDAKLRTDGSGNPAYGTYMVFGLNLGGKAISVYEDFGSGVVQRNFSPTYVMMDITDPRDPKLMWERSYSGLGLNTVIPAPVRTGSLNGDTGKHFLVFGSGPTDYDHTSSQKGHMFVVDMLTGEPYGTSATEDWIWESTNDSYFNSPLALDVFQTNNTDAVYIAENFFNKTWQADLHKVSIPCTKCIWEDDTDGSPYEKDEVEYKDDPTSWSFNQIFDSPGPITVKLNVAQDSLKNILLYFGTGRVFNNADKIDAAQQYLYCLKDPFYNVTKYDGTYAHNFGSTLLLEPADLLNSDGITVTTAGTVSGYAGSSEFYDFADKVRRLEDGWRLSLNADGTSPSERVITRTAVFGGIYLTPTFTPDEDICSLGGNTNLLGGYFETGTAYLLPIFYVLPAGAPETTVSRRHPDTFVGMPPSTVVFHVGQEKGAMASIQLSTGEVIQLFGRPAISIESDVMEQWDDPNQVPMKNDACEWER
jgi:type IV pilus assembly protein PilY1